MPKAKTSRSAKKRFRKSNSGLLLCRHAGMRHNLRKKATKQKRRLSHPMMVSKSDQPAILRLLLS